MGIVFGLFHRHLLGFVVHPVRCAHRMDCQMDWWAMDGQDWPPTARPRVTPHFRVPPSRGSHSQTGIESVHSKIPSFGRCAILVRSRSDRTKMAREAKTELRSKKIAGKRKQGRERMLCSCSCSRRPALALACRSCPAWICSLPPPVRLRPQSDKDRAAVWPLILLLSFRFLPNAVAFDLRAEGRGGVVRCRGVASGGHGCPP